MRATMRSSLGTNTAASAASGGVRPRRRAGQVLAIAMLTSSAPLAAHAKGDDGLSREVPPPPPADIPLDMVDTEGRTHFQLVTRWTPATGTHVWNIDVSGAFRVTEGLAITLGAPTAIAVPQRAGVDSRFALGNLHLGVGGGTRLAVKRPDDVDDLRLGVRIGGAFDVYFPTAPIPDKDRATALVALHYRPLEPGLWAGRALAFRARGHLGVAGRAWSVDGELGLTPAFTLGADSDAWVWLTLVARARVVVAHVFEPFLEIGGNFTAASPNPAQQSSNFDAAGFQLTPGVRFHIGDFSPALFVAIQPADDFGKITFGVDIAGGSTKRHRAVDELLDF